MSLVAEKYHIAMEFYEIMLQSKSEDKEAWSDLGQIFYNLSEYHKAIDCFQKGIKETSRNTGIWYKIGLVYLKLREYEKAIEYFQRVVKIHPHLKSVWHILIDACIKIGYFEKAKEYFKTLKSHEIKLNQSIECVLNKILKSECDILRVLLTDRVGCFTWQIQKNHLLPLKDFNELIINMSAIFHGTEELGRSAQFKKFNLSTLEYGNGKMFISQTGPNGIIIIISERDVCVGMIRLILKSASSHLENKITEFQGVNLLI
ncbi:MAG TPA: tetratricopeptide repeat protein [Candidatus Deferrimicrobium sp.]|nr:tetratricopeptide repeat protein [Candidatus Deferrimicrobium sp.]